MIPVYNEATVISKTIDQLESEFKSHGFQGGYELVLVNDGSTDETLSVLKDSKLKNSNLRIINIRKNVGHMKALELGLRQCTGDLVISMDGDGQDAPIDAVRMFELAISLESQNEKFEVIQAVRIDRQVDSWFKRKSADFYYRVMSKIIGVNLSNAADFRLMTRSAVEFLLKTSESPKVFRLLIPFYGLSVRVFPVRRLPRMAGQSKYPLRKMFLLGIDSVFTFTTYPLFLLSVVSLIFSILSLICVALFFILYVMDQVSFMVFFFVGAAFSFTCFLSLSLGVMAEYLGRTYRRIQNHSNPATDEIR